MTCSQLASIRVLFSEVKCCEARLTLGIRVEGGGVADGSTLFRVAAGPHPVAIGSHKHALGLSLFCVRLVLQVRHGDIEIIRRPI